MFAKGLYGEYLKRGEDFVKDYDVLLKATGKNKISHIAKMIDIDIYSVDFWKNSLKMIEKDIQKFITLV